MTGRATRARRAVAPVVDLEAPGSEPVVPGSVPVRPDQEPLARRRGEPADPTEHLHTRCLRPQRPHRVMGRAAGQVQQTAGRLECMVNRIEIEVALHLGKFNHIFTT